MAWLTGWDKRKEITVTENSAAALTDFQVKVDVTYAADMQADFDDIRFTDSDGETLLDHWLEVKVDSTSATFWVKVPTIPSSSTATIYMYYGNAGASSASDIQATFIDGDDFGRASLNESSIWTKSANNPLSAAGYGDPHIYHESGTFYLFADDLTNGNIVLWSTSTPDQVLSSWTDHGTILSKGAGGAWDDDKIQDPFVIKVGSTYHMWYGGSDGTVGGFGIGHATSSSLTSGWSKDAANPVLDSVDVGSGCNEPSVYYDASAAAGEEFKMLFTYNGKSPSTVDIGIGHIGLAYSSDGSSWTQQVDAIDLAQAYQDQEQILDGSTFNMFVNNDQLETPTAGGNVDESYHILQSTSSDHENWSTPRAGGGLAKGADTTPDDQGAYAPSVVEVGGTYYMFYQSADGSSQKISLATASSLTPNVINWWDSIGAFSITSNRLHKNSNHESSWEILKNYVPLSPPYIYEADLEFDTEDTAGYVYGVRVAETSIRFYGVIVDPSANQIGLWENDHPEVVSASSVLSNTTSYTVDLATAHKIRAIVTASNLQIDWYDGTTWQTNILSTAQTFHYSYVGFYNYDNNAGTNQNRYYADNFRVREYASSEPTVEFGAEATDFQPRSGVAIANGVMMV